MAVKNIRISVGELKYKINLIATLTMDGLVISIVGGEKTHIGAVAISIPRPSLSDPSRVSSTTSVFTLVGHKDDELAKPIAEELAKKLNQTVVVVAGVHIEKATPKDIEELLRRSKDAVDVLLKKMKCGKNKGVRICR